MQGLASSRRNARVLYRARASAADHDLGPPSGDNSRALGSTEVVGLTTWLGSVPRTTYAFQDGASCARWLEPSVAFGRLHRSTLLGWIGRVGVSDRGGN